MLAAEELEPRRSPRDFFDLTRRVAPPTFFQSGVPGFDYPRRTSPRNVKFVGPLLPHRKATALSVDASTGRRSASTDP